MLFLRNECEGQTDTNTRLSFLSLPPRTSKLYGSKQQAKYQAMQNKRSYKNRTQETGKLYQHPDTIAVRACIANVLQKDSRVGHRSCMNKDPF